MKKDWYFVLARKLLKYKWKIFLIFFFTIAAAAFTCNAPYMLGKTVDMLLLSPDTNEWIKCLTIFLGVLIIGNIFGTIRSYISSEMTTAFMLEMNKDALESILKTSYSFFINSKQGDILQSITQDVKALQEVELDIIPNISYELLLAIISLISVLQIYWPLGIIGFIIYFVYLFPVHYFGEKLKKVSKDLREQNSRLRQMLIERIKTIEQIKIYGTENSEYAQIKKEQDCWRVLLQKKYLIDQFYRSFPRVLNAMIPAIVYLIGGWQFFLGNLSIGNLVMITGYLPYISAPIKSFASIYLSLKNIAFQMEKVVNYIELPQEDGRSDDKEVIHQIRGKIELKDVSVENERGIILKHVSFVVNPGESVALVGATGAGKSTILKLITRLIDPTHGEIEVDDKPLKMLKITEVRKRIGNLIQDTFLFNDTLVENLKYLNPTASEGEIEELIDAVGLKEKVELLPQRYYTEIEENGKRLSGGQRQRLGVVRALLKEMDVLLMDEATSSLDIENEIAVHSIIKKIARNKTIIYAAHRLETVTDADKILVFQSGEIVECGTHEELIKQNGYYRKLWDKTILIGEKRQ